MPISMVVFIAIVVFAVVKVMNKAKQPKEQPKPDVERMKQVFEESLEELGDVEEEAKEIAKRKIERMHKKHPEWKEGYILYKKPDVWMSDEEYFELLVGNMNHE